MTEVGIVDTRNIIKLIQEKYGYDFSDYALTSLKRRLESIMQFRNIRHPDLLINRIKESLDFFEQILDDIPVPSTEMFRDPSLWRLLRDELLPKIYKESSRFKIWLPGAVSGDELFSLCIVLRELDLLDKVQVHATCLSKKSIDFIKTGIHKQHKVETSEENYQRANGKLKFSDFCKERDGAFYRDISLINQVSFDIQKTELDNTPTGVKLILYRNKMIYFNPTLQIKVLKNLHNSLITGGHLIVGAKECLANLHNVNDFVLVNANEGIYKKK
ncbi:MAG: protein-glutamate O-methyltransferase CheR [Bacteroidales bacterium]|nr:protein-glutamate O-methyltransferase CheR [Bacteroidales bacterium]